MQCARRMIIVPLHAINLPPIRPFNTLSNGVSHTNYAVVLKIQRLEHGTIARACTEIVVKSVNMP